jgi:hypothetical protein
LDIVRTIERTKAAEPHGAAFNAVMKITHNLFRKKQRDGRQSTLCRERNTLPEITKPS